MFGLPVEHAVSHRKHVAFGLHLPSRVHGGGWYDLHGVRGGNLQDCDGFSGLLSLSSRDVQECAGCGDVCAVSFSHLFCARK